MMRSTTGWLVAATVCAGCQSGDVSSQLDVAAQRGFLLAEQVLVVAPNGTGTACNAEQPCALDYAKTALRDLAAKAEGDLAVELTGGLYRLTTPLRFDAADSGQNGHRVTWRARAGETPVLSGAQQVTGWTLADANTGLWKASVPRELRTRQLYIDGVRIPVAQGAAPVALIPSAGGYTAIDDTYASWRNPDQLELVYPGGAGMWTEPRCRVAHIKGATITMAEPCWTNTTTRHKVSAPALDPYNMSPSTLPGRIENAYELMQSGQYYLDVTKHVLFYRAAPGFDPSKADVEAPVLEQLLVATGTLEQPVHDLTFSGLTFAYATWNLPSTGIGFSEIQANLTITAALDDPPQGTCTFGRPEGSCPFGAYTSTPAAVSFKTADRVELVRNRFEHLGAAGLLIQFGSHDNRVEGNVFADISGIGVQLGDSNDPHPSYVDADERETCARNTISNNLIHHIGQEYHGAVGIMVFTTQHTQVKNNEIHDVSYTGISSGALNGHAATPTNPDATINVNSDNEISNNLIYRYLMTLGDGGAIYLEGHQFETPRRPDGTIDQDMAYARGLHLAGNVVYHQGMTGNAFYDDIGSQWITWQGNIQWQAWSGQGGCLPVGHIRFIENHLSDTLGDFGCGAPIDMQLERNVRLPRKPGAYDMPMNVLQSAGLAPEYRDIANASAPLVEYASPAEGHAQPGQKILVAGSAFGPGAAVRWGTQAATALEVLSANFMIATAPEGANLGSLTVTTERGTANLPINDTDTAIEYQGDWKLESFPGAYEDSSLHTARLDGAFFSLAFEGTGVEYITDLDSDRGATEIYVDGALRDTVSCKAPLRIHQQVCARVAGLSSGPHTLKVVKKSGPTLMLDALRVLP